MDESKFGRKLFTIEFEPDLTEADAKEIVCYLVTIIRGILLGQYHRIQGKRSFHV